MLLRSVVETLPWRNMVRSPGPMAPGGLRASGLVRPLAPGRMQGRFMAHQSSLARLPVPPLVDTLTRYADAVAPLAGEDSTQMEHTRRLLREFAQPGGVGEVLQAGLERRARERENWLSDWWLLMAYLEYRLPVVVHSSPGVVLPHQPYRDANGQLWFAAQLIAGVLDYKAMVDNESLPVEHLGGRPLCMDQYYRLFSSCRVPGLPRDSVRNVARDACPPKHITVASNAHFYHMEVYGADGKALDVEDLYEQLKNIRTHSLDLAPGVVGLLTAQDRDSWAKTYQVLTADEKHRGSVDAVERSAFALCLDGPGQRPEWDMSLAAAQMLHGGGSALHSANRWFDKTLQFIVGDGGTCGLIYEHAPAEGPPIVALVDHVVAYCEKSRQQMAPATSQGAPVHGAEPRHLQFSLSPELLALAAEAKVGLDQLVANLEVECFVFKNFGKGFPKSQKLSPDAFIQIGLQLAYYRLYAQPCATYESASLRMFRLGRTETIRSTSRHSLAFSRAMADPNCDRQTKVQLMKKAIQAHREYTTRAITGQGVDRHLLGLKLQALEEGLPLPEIYSDPTYQAAMHYRLSTSQVPARTDCVMCFGPVVEDGYGVCYNPMENHINLAVSAFRSCPDTSAARLAQALHQALLDLQELALSSPVSKL